MEIYFDTNLNKRQTEAQLNRRGLLKDKRRLPSLGIFKVDLSHDIDTTIYTVVDTGGVEEAEGKYLAVYEKTRRESNPALDIDIRRLLKDAVNRRREKILTAGVNFTYEGQQHTLQTRTADDLMDWTHVKLAASGKVAGETQRIHTESDDDLYIPASDAVTLIDKAVEYLGNVKYASFDLKKNMDTAETDDAAFDLFEANIDTCWPDGASVLAITSGA